MKEKLPLNELVGSRLSGYLENKDGILLVFEHGYMLAEPYLDDVSACVDSGGDVNVEDYSAEELAACEFATAKEIAELLFSMRAQRAVNANKTRFNAAAQAIRTLAENDPEAARQLVAEAAQKYGVKP